MKLFFPKNGHAVQKTRDPLIRKIKQRTSKTRKSIMDLIVTTPGLTESEIAQWLSLSKQTVNYHIREMERENKIRVEREAGNVRCYPNPEGKMGMAEG